MAIGMRPGLGSEAAAGPDLLRELVARGDVSAASVCDGAVSLADLSRRNRVLGLYVEGRLARVFKVLGAEMGDREPEVYRALGCATPAFTHLPEHRLTSDTLVLEVPPGARTLAVHCRRYGLGRTWAHRLGRVLAELHAIEMAPSDTAVGEAPAVPPGMVLGPSFTTESWWSLSGANRQLLSALGEVDTQPLRGIRRLADDWSPSAFVHGDLRWENIVLTRRCDGARLDRLQLIDWETAGAGDRAWDLGGLVAQVVCDWISSMKAKPGDRVDTMVDAATISLEDGDAWLAELWRSYRAASGSATGLPGEAVRTAGYAGVRLIQWAFEAGQLLPRTTATALTLAQAGSNLIARPEVVLVSLLPRLAHEAALA